LRRERRSAHPERRDLGLAQADAGDIDVGLGRVAFGGGGHSDLEPGDCPLEPVFGGGQYQPGE